MISWPDQDREGIDLGEATDAQSIALLKTALDLCPEADVLTVLRDWIKEHGLEGELE
jgi:hypothetical protein